MEDPENLGSGMAGAGDNLVKQYPPATHQFLEVPLTFSFGKWSGGVNTKLGAFEKAVSEIRDDIKKILLWIPSKTVDSDSPLKLTKVGEKVAETISARSIVKNFATDLRTRAEGKLPYDIQDLCFDFIRDEYKPSDEIEKNIKQCAYENGIDRAEVLDVLAIELRNEVLWLIEQNT